ncbi:RHS repeat-associated core domain-containing protein [Pseudomonas sp. zfem002]|uniref:RHS repeat-associated core domain-containing protein n=1 Tax=Pseudomonas sp. zfem002 TaxID=3078197 RepID=UPI00292848BC|nr:RHS repeat-associated core domain-containing protein [Pseudomonas sp. zfem002]MDU9393487.1 RHS repeat-associated core domain-containing protein [Pseudomonas sp. zfem002]
MKRNWTDLGKVWSGRDLAKGERVTISVFDKVLKTLVEQTTFTTDKAEHRPQYVWVADFCRHINSHLALVRAGVENDAGDWVILESGYKNHYWTYQARELLVVTTVPRKDNWEDGKQIKIHSDKTLAAGTRMRVNVRNANGQLLETLTFTPDAKRLTPGLWTKDLATQINATSLYVRAGRLNEQTIEPYAEKASNFIWTPFNGDFLVDWWFDEPKDAGKIEADRDAVAGEQVSLLVFDSIAERLLDRITLSAKAGRLGKAQWPADLAKQVNASSAHVRITDNTIQHRQGELRTFTTALHLDNWLQGDTIEAKADLTAAERIVVTVATAGRGNFCEALTFTPDPARLKAVQWAKDLAGYINSSSRYLKAGVKDTTKKTIVAQENAKTNLIWLPKDSALKVSWEKTTLREVGYLSLERDLRVNEGCRVYVLDDATDEILRDITFTPSDKRNGRYLAAKDLATRINGQTQLIAAGEKTANEQPKPIDSGYRNVLWGCAKDVRAFSTLLSLKNFDKGKVIGGRDLVEDEQVIVLVKGEKSGRIFEALSFIPNPGRYGRSLWPKDLAARINAESRFIRAGQENAKLFLMEPASGWEVNAFWIPKQSGLVVEMIILSGIPLVWPGMTSEAKQLFDQYAEARRHITVDAKTGQPSLQIPLADLYADDSFKDPLKVCLAYSAEQGVHIRLGGLGKNFPRKQDATNGEFLFVLRDGRSTPVNMKTEINGGDFKVGLVFEPALLQGSVVPSKFKNVPTKFTVTYKDGGVDTFLTPSFDKDSQQVKLSSYAVSSGKSLVVSYAEGRVKKISRDGVAVLEVENIDDDSEEVGGFKVVLFPNCEKEKLTWKFKQKEEVDSRTVFEVDGFAAAGKTCYSVVHDSDGKLISIDVEKRYSFAVDKKTETDKSLYQETLEYTLDGKVNRHVIAPGGGMDELIHDYDYTTDVTRLTGYFKASNPRTAFVRCYRFSGEQSFLEEYGSDAVPICTKRSHSLDKSKKQLASQAKVWEGDVVVDETGLVVDAIGNPVSRRENHRTTYYTYYNNYQQFRVTEKETRVEDWSLFGCLFKGLDYINPVGVGFAIGGSGGMTWGTRIDSTVEMLPASNDYAQKAFHLPLAIGHSGSDRPFCGDVESELVCQKVNGKEQAQRLTFYGYGKVDGRIRQTKKLTILQPDCSKVDVATEQLVVATAAAKPFIDSLKKQIAGASGEAKKSYEQVLADLNKSLKAQSEANREGYRLNSWNAASMYLETFEYHTDAKQPGYGMVKSVKTALVLADGEVRESQARTTSFAYTCDKDDSNRLTITTTVSQKDQTDIVSSQTRSRNTGRLLESVDSEQVRTVYTYDPQGNLMSETVSKDGKELHKTSHTLVRQLVGQYDRVEDGGTTRIEKDVLGRQQALWLKPPGATAFVQAQTWTYDAIGRLASSVESDYGKDNKKVAQRHTTWTYDETSGRIDIGLVLRDGAGKELKRTTQTRTPAVKGERFSQGKFSLDRQYNTSKGTFTEHHAMSGGTACKIERGLSAEGLMKWIRYLKIDKAGKESEHDRIDFTYNAHAELSKITPKLGAASSFVYDHSGRLLTSSRDGITLHNSYHPDTLAAVSGESHISTDAGKQSLGTQSEDLLGRVTNRKVNGHDSGFTYTGSSRLATLTSPGTAPTALDGCTASLDKTTRTHVQSVKDGKETRTSTLEFSTAGRVLSFTDLTGAITRYEYDFFNRVIRSSSEHCEAEFSYADNGLLSSESIKSVKAGLTMKVAYVYDEFGQETRRTFTCAGVDTLSLERTLLADGRLARSTLKKADKEVHADSYEYDNSLRLSKWTASGSKSDTFSHDALGDITAGGGRWFYYHESKPGQVSLVNERKAGQSRPDDGSGTERSHDAVGRLTIDGERRLAYHGNGQVSTFSTDGDKSKYSFTYDAEGRVRGGTLGKKSDTYHYRGECVYALVQSDGDKSDGFAKRTLVLRNDSRACLLQDAITDDKDSRSFELRDANGTLFASIDLGSKAITLFRYEPYGKRYAGSKAQTWLGFKGEPLNRVGLYHLGNGYRLYDPDWGRFLSPDSWSPFGAGGAAAYVFGNADPVNHHDPSGHQVIAQYSRWSNAPVIHSTAFRIAVGALGVLIAPFTAGMSALLAIATTALSAISFAFDMAALIISESDPQLSRTLEAWGQVFGIMSAAAGAAMTLHGIKGIPRNMFRVRGGPPVRTPVKWIKTPNELRLAQQARAKALSDLVEASNKAKAAGTYEAFKAANLHPEGSVAGSVDAGSTVGTSFTQRIGNTTKSLFTGTISQVDDSMWDFLGFTLDLHTGPNTLVQKFRPATTTETEGIAIVAAPLPERAKL